jgi:hypothetical protein
MPAIVPKARSASFLIVAGIWIIGGECELHLNVAIIDLDRFHQSE